MEGSYSLVRAEAAVVGAAIALRGDQRP